MCEPRWRQIGQAPGQGVSLLNTGKPTALRMTAVDKAGEASWRRAESDERNATLPFPELPNNCRRCTLVMVGNWARRCLARRAKLSLGNALGALGSRWARAVRSGRATGLDEREGTGTAD